MVRLIEKTYLNPQTLGAYALGKKWHHDVGMNV